MASDIPLSELGPILTLAGNQIAPQKYTIIACYSLFIYDYLLTLNDEIKYIWRRQFSLGSFIFFVNRYYAMITLALTVFENFSLAVDSSRCKHLIGLQVFGDGIPLTIMTNFLIGLRVYALYKRNRFIGGFLLTYIVAELGVLLWIYLTPSITPVVVPGPPSVNMIPVLHLCIVSNSPRISTFQAGVFPVMQAMYDSVAFALIVFKTAATILRERGRYEDVRTLMVKNGLLYYAIVFSGYFTWFMMTLFCPPGIRGAAEFPSLSLTCLSVNRLTLSLRAFTADGEGETTGAYPSGLAFGGRSLKRRRSWIGTSTFEVSDEDTYVSRGVNSRLESRQESTTFELHNRQTDGLEYGLEMISEDQ
ncbi:hypothetical protein SCHPADRAFT_928690 [Schizopora paradoxa]|uniref:DUF6533 domain-containing protein n=1 Tax=Schizopora paradoxa TaxID=27342 RepID=A0A0H2RNK2_9AGAM|nr:hypothetical protein SCHPADRAFT_928690 [Schizopora paradoxa]